MTDFLIAADGDEVQAFELLADWARARAAEGAAFERDLANEARRPVPREPRAKVGPVDRAATAPFVSDDEAIVFFRGMRAWVRAGKPIA